MTDSLLAPALDELSRAVASARTQVTAFLAGSETIFLETGESLETLRNEALSLVTTSAKVVAGARAGDDDPVERLAEGCRQIDRHLAASRSSLDLKAQRLRAILAAIERLGAFRHLFRRAASALRMLGMSTSIENARAGMESTGFATVASDVRRLGGLVETRFEGVLDESLTMKRTAVDALARVTDLTTRQGQRASSMLAAASEGLESLRALARSASAVGTRAAAVSQRVAGGVTSVVVALQVHDITRQMIEHTLEGLREIDDDLSAARHAAADAGQSAVAAHEPAELARLQTSQLGQARAKLEDALHGIPTSLRTMAAAARELADETCHLGEGAQGGSLLQGVERAVAHAVSTLHDQLRQEAEIEAAMNEVMGTISSMLERLREVERIGQALKIIGLNAGVEAARTTQGGRVLSVLARAIQELSIEVGRHTAAFAGAVRQIAGEASMTTDATSEAAGEGDGQAIAAELERLLVNVHAYNTTLVGAIDVLVRVAAELERGVDEIASRIGEQGRGIAVLAAVESSLNEACAAVLARAGGAARGAPTQRLRAASARYTTEAERAIHRSISGGAAAEPAPAAPAGSGQAKDLGDNVELF